MGLVWRFLQMEKCKKTKPPRKVQPKGVKATLGKYWGELQLLYTKCKGLTILELLILLRIELLIELKTHDDSAFLIFR